MAGSAREVDQAFARESRDRDSYQFIESDRTEVPRIPARGLVVSFDPAMTGCDSQPVPLVPGKREHTLDEVCVTTPADPRGANDDGPTPDRRPSGAQKAIAGHERRFHAPAINIHHQEIPAYPQPEQPYDEA